MSNRNVIIIKSVIVSNFPVARNMSSGVMDHLKRSIPFIPSQIVYQVQLFIKP
ncbi:hypothetical protein SynWH8101_1246 [Synechococcus sp. WH 8101]|nr:hypothetical protein SynWH8101_1246 [Synechococcus sp. WH 8101]